MLYFGMLNDAKCTYKHCLQASHLYFSLPPALRGTTTWLFKLSTLWCISLLGFRAPLQGHERRIRRRRKRDEEPEDRRDPGRLESELSRICGFIMPLLSFLRTPRGSASDVVKDGAAASD